MKKSNYSESKDLLRTAGKTFVRLPSTWSRRVTASGVTFGGEYVKIKTKKRRKNRD